MTRIADAQNFLDINGLNDIRTKAKAGDQDSKDAALKGAAKQFEAIFMQMLLKSMRSAQDVLESDSPFNSESTKFYRDMHDQQLSLELSNNGSLGLSDLIVRQLGGEQDTFTPSSVLRLDSQQLANRAFVIDNDNQGSLDRQINDHKGSLQGNKNIHTPQNVPSFEQPKDFVSALTEPAKLVEKKLNVPFQVVIAQAALETGWGQKIIKTGQGESSNNLFNIKADGRWQGDKTQKETLEFENGVMLKKKEPFRVYGSIQESINDYVNFLSNSPRYQGALESVNNVEQFLHKLQGAGYATDPNYAKKILGTLKTVTGLLDN